MRFRYGPQGLCFDDNNQPIALGDPLSFSVSDFPRKIDLVFPGGVKCVVKPDSKYDPRTPAFDVGDSYDVVSSTGPKLAWFWRSGFGKYNGVIYARCLLNGQKLRRERMELERPREFRIEPGAVGATPRLQIVFCSDDFIDEVCTLMPPAPIVLSDPRGYRLDEVQGYHNHIPTAPKPRVPFHEELPTDPNIVIVKAGYAGASLFWDSLDCTATYKKEVYGFVLTRDGERKLSNQQMLNLRLSRPTRFDHYVVPVKEVVVHFQHDTEPAEAYSFYTEPHRTVNP